MKLQRYRAPLLFSLALLLCLSIVGITFFQQTATGLAYFDGSALRHRTPTTIARTATPTSPLVSPTVESQQLNIFVEPNTGEQVLLNAINNAHQSIWLEMYLLSDKNIISALETAAGRKLDVRVMLDPHPFGGGSPQSTIDALKAAGAQAETSNPSFTFTHEKGMVIDGQTAYIMTCNFTFSALNGKNREYGIIDNIAQDVADVSAIFIADWNRSPVTSSSLVVSPINARSSLLNLITNAHSSLLIEAEEMQDSAIEQAITAAAQRGVQIEVILPHPQQGTDSNSAGITKIKAGGALVKEDTQLYMHAKIIVADGSLGFVGSENISTNSLDKNRELGIILSTSTVITTLQQSFQQDWSASQSV